MIKPTFHYAATVGRVVDGDTLDVDIDLGMRIHFKARLRLAHVNCPEKNTPEGVAAKNYVEGLLPPVTVVMVSTAKPDKYGRALADVQLGDGRDLAHLLIDGGFAVPYEGGAR